VSDGKDIHTPAPPPALPPQQDSAVSFGTPQPGTDQPMPDQRRDSYESRIRDSVDAQAAGAEKASKLFIR
jgi:hypothetical protein